MPIEPVVGQRPVIADDAVDARPEIAAGRHGDVERAVEHKIAMNDGQVVEGAADDVGLAEIVVEVRALPSARSPLMVSVPGASPRSPGFSAPPSSTTTLPPMVPVPPSAPPASTVVVPVAADWSPLMMSVPSRDVCRCQHSCCCRSGL